MSNTRWLRDQDSRASRPYWSTLLAVVFAILFPNSTSAWQDRQAPTETDRFRARCELAGLEPSEAAMMASQPLEETGELALRLAWRARKLGQPQLDAAVEAALPARGESGQSKTEPEALADSGRLDRTKGVFSESASASGSNEPGLLPGQGELLESFRLGVVSVAGDLVELKPWPELDDSAEPPFWRATLEAGDGTRFVVAVSRVPASLESAALPLPGARATGFFAGKLEGNGNGEWLVASHRLGWFPSTAPPGAVLEPGLLALAQAGFDVGLTEDIRRAGTRPLTVGEREAWQAFLAATARVTPASWEPVAASGAGAGLVDLFDSPEHITGRPVTMRGTVKRLTVVETGLSRPAGMETSARQLEVIVNTGGRGVAITNAAGERMEFGSRIPVTVLASGSAAAEIQEGASIAFDGFAYRFWTYESEASAEQGAAAGQTMPLVMAWRIRPVDSGQSSLDALMNWTTIGLVALVAGIAATVWWMNRRDRMTRP